MRSEHADKIQKLFDRIPEFLYEYPGMGKFYSGYGTGLFTCECFFDALALDIAGYDSGEVARNLVRLNLLLQDKETGHIPRHTVDLVDDPNKLKVEGWSSMSQFINGRMVNPWTWYEADEHAQPFLYQIAAFATRQMGGDVSWITPEVYDGLMLYMKCWLTNWDRTGEGLSVLASAQHGISDNSFSRAGTWRSYYCQSPDFNAFLYLELLNAQRIASALGKLEDAAWFASQAQIKREKINELLWDEEAGCYFGRDIRTGKHIPVDAINNYYPLWAGIASPEQARRMVEEHLMNPAKFYTKFPFSSYAQDEKTYTQYHVNDTILLDDYVMLPAGHCNWRGGCWSHPHYWLCMALNRYGYKKEAMDVAAKVFDMVIDNPYICEWHNAETGEMQGAEIFAGVQILQRLMPTLLECGFDVNFAEDALDKSIESACVRNNLKG